MTRTELMVEIANCKDWIAVLSERVAGLQRELRSLDSKEFIRRHNLTRADVTPSPKTGKFKDCHEFAREVLRENPKASLVEWNGRIYGAAVLAAGYTVSWANYEDLPEAPLCP